MPTRRTRYRSVRLGGAALARLAAGLLLAALVFAPGCRMFRCQKASDDSIAAARQLSLHGLDAEQRGQWEKAEALFAAAVSKCPRDERAHHGYAESLWQRGARDAAIIHMEE